MFVRGLNIRSELARAAGDFSLTHGEAIDGYLALSVEDLAGLTFLPVSDTLLSGSVTLNTSVAGTSDLPLFAGNAMMRNLRIAQFEFDSVTAAADHDADSVRISITATGTENETARMYGAFAVTGDSTLQNRIRNLRECTLSGDIQRVPLIRLQAFFTSATDLGGRLTGHYRYRNRAGKTAAHSDLHLESIRILNTVIRFG